MGVMFGLLVEIDRGNAVAGRAVHGHGHLEGHDVHGRGPVVAQMIGLEHVAHAVDHIGLVGRLVERGRGKGEQVLRQPFFDVHDLLRLLHVLGVFQVALDLALVLAFPAEDDIWRSCSPGPFRG